MYYCFVLDGKFSLGDTKAEAISGLVKWSLDYANGVLLIEGKPDTITYATDFTMAEMRSEVTNRLTRLMEQRGGMFFQRMA